MTRGKYIVIEGPEGVGKTTQLHELSKRLQAAGLPVRMFREPDSQSDLTARAIRQLTQDPRYPMNTRTEVLLYNAARAQSLHVIKQSVENGVICLVDRNYLTTLAIQYYGRGDVPDYATINSIIEFAVGGVEPDLCVLLDAPVNVLHKRLNDRYHGERFDNLSEAFLERVRAGYLWEANQRQLPVIYAIDPPEQVADTIWKLVTQTLAVREPSAATAAAVGPTSVKEIIQQKKLPDSEATSSMQATSGAESTGQPADSLQITLEGVSKLAAASFISPTLGSTLTPNSNGPRYYTPDTLQEATLQQYKQGMEMLFAAYEAMHTSLVAHLKESPEAQKQADDVLRAILPLAATSTLNLTATTAQIQELITDLMNQPHIEVQAIARSLGEQGQDSSKPHLRSVITAELQELAKEHLSDNYAITTDDVTLIDFWPKNELLLIPDMLYAYSTQSQESLQSEVNGWPYERKTAIFNAYVGNRDNDNMRRQPGPALEKAHYSWDLVSSYDSLCDIKRHLIADALAQQESTPRYGYDIPELIETAGLTEQYEACFDASLKLHSYLHKAGYAREAQYVTLMGHKLRWKATYNAREAYRILEVTYTNPATATLVRRMQEKLAEVHPLTAEGIK